MTSNIESIWWVLSKLVGEILRTSQNGKWNLYRVETKKKEDTNLKTNWLRLALGGLDIQNEKNTQEKYRVKHITPLNCV